MVTTISQPNQRPERRDREQYFFDAPTVRAWAAIAAQFPRPCFLCAPTAGAELSGRGLGQSILDIDERFAVYEGFQRYDLSRPDRLPVRPGVILCDPPFFSISLGRLRAAVDLLSDFDPAQPVAITYLKRRQDALLSRFDLYNLRPTGARATYRSIDASGRNEIEVYANFPWPLPPSLPVVQRSTA